MTRGLKLRGGGKKGPTARKCLQPKQGLVFQPPPPPRSASTTNHLRCLTISPPPHTPLHSLPPSLLFLCLLCPLLFKVSFRPSRRHYGKIKAEHGLPGAISCCTLTGRSEILLVCLLSCIYLFFYYSECTVFYQPQEHGANFKNHLHK